MALEVCASKAGSMYSVRRRPRPVPRIVPWIEPYAESIGGGKRVPLGWRTVAGYPPIPITATATLCGKRDPVKELLECLEKALT